MGIVFNGATKIISLTSGTTFLDVKDLYSKWKAWSIDNFGYMQAMSVIGGDPIGNGISLGETFFLLNNWKIRPQEANHQLVINGNLFSDDESNFIVPTLGNYNVTVSLQVSSLSQGVSTTGGSGSTITASDVWNYSGDKILSPVGVSNIVTAIWATTLNNLVANNTIGRLLRRLGAVHGLTSANVIVTETSRTTSDSLVNQTISGTTTKTMSGSP